MYIGSRRGSRKENTLSCPFGTPTTNSLQNYKQSCTNNPSLVHVEFERRGGLDSRYHQTAFMNHEGKYTQRINSLPGQSFKVAH